MCSKIPPRIQNVSTWKDYGKFLLWWRIIETYKSTTYIFTYQLRSLFLYLVNVIITSICIQIFQVLGTDTPIILFSGGSFDFQLPTLVKTLITRKNSGHESIRTYQSLARCFLLHWTGKSDKTASLIGCIPMCCQYNLLSWTLQASV
jgi:hypothetical protein